MPTNGGEWEALSLPLGTYNATFSPDGQGIIYAASEGLGFGSALGIFDLEGGSTMTWQLLSDQVIAFPRWSPDGSQLAYVLMPDSNVPFVVGELWLADQEGQPVRLLDEIDAGHGYPPVWSPDGETIAYVRRENPEMVMADQDPRALHSNIY